MLTNPPIKDNLNPTLWHYWNQSVRHTDIMRILISKQKQCNLLSIMWIFRLLSFHEPFPILVKRDTWPKKEIVKEKKQKAYKLNNLFPNYIGLITFLNGIKFKVVHFFNVNVSIYINYISTFMYVYTYRKMDLCMFI